MARPRTAYLALGGAAFLFGATFVVIKEAIERFDPLAFVGWRFLLGAVALMIVARPRGIAVWRDGLGAGLFLFGGFALQTVGLAETSASNSGLITGLYVVFTPLVAALWRRRSPSPAGVGGAVLAFGGLALLTVGDGLELAAGDLLTVGCAVAFAIHIVVLARTAPRHPVVPFTAVQLMVTSVLALASATVAGNLTTPPADVWPAVVATGLVVSAGAMLIQVWSQTVIGPNRTAIVLALEPAFAAATAAVVLGERLTARGWWGAGLILVGIYAVLVLTPEDEDDLEAAEAITAAH